MIFLVITSEINKTFFRTKCQWKYCAYIIGANYRISLDWCAQALALDCHLEIYVLKCLWLIILHIGIYFLLYYTLWRFTKLLLLMFQISFRQSELVKGWPTWSPCYCTYSGVHELGHFLAAKDTGVKLGVPYFVPSWQVIG